MHKFTFVDLFAGIGGFHIGLRAGGGDCVYSSEWNKYSAKTYAAWTGHEPNVEDIREIVPSSLPEHDVLAAGFPCQPFSLAGVSKKISLGRQHGFQDLEQGNLFFTICDIVSEKKPKIVLLENVKNLRSHDKGRTWEVIQESLKSLGYVVRWKIVDAKYWVPQHRERVFIVAFREDLWEEDAIDEFSFPNNEGRVPPALESILESNPDPKYMLTENLWAYLQMYAAKHKAKGNGFGYSLADRSSISRTLSARYHKDGSEILISQPYWERPRRLTPDEARKLMGFTEELAGQAGTDTTYRQVVSDTQAYRQFGNAVSPLVVRDIALEISRMLVRP